MLGASLSLSVGKIPLVPTGLGVPSLALAETGDNEISYTIGFASGANQYRVERSTDGVTYTLLANQSTHGTYTDGGLTEGQTYYYRVRSENTLTSEVSNYRVASLALLAEFSNVSLTESTTIQNSVNTLTLVFRPDVAISATGTITLSGLSGSATATNSSLTVAGAGASLFGSVGDWNNNGTLILTVASGQSVPNNSDTTITFDVTNPAFPNSGVSSVTLVSSGFNTSSVSGTFFNVTESVFNGSLSFPTIQVFDNESEFIDQTDATQYTIVHAKDTDKLYVWDGNAWYKYNNDLVNTYSVDFDGTNNYMSISDADIFSMGNGSGTDNAFSISGWFNADSIGTFYIATKDASGAREWAFRTVSSQLHFFAFGTGGGYIGRKYGTNLNAGQWYHAVVTYDASKASSGIKLYLNGTRVDDADYASGTFTASKNTTAEVRVAGLQVNDTYANGKVDELSIFNTELSASDVTAIYNSGSPDYLSSYSPVGWWRMGDNDSGTGTTITDQGSGGNNGTLVNGPTFSTTVP